MSPQPYPRPHPKPHQPSQKIWDQILENQPTLACWKPWLNKHGLDGSLIDHTDSLSFVDYQLRKAIVIEYKPQDTHPIAAWVSTFGDLPSETIDQLVLIFSDIQKAQSIFPALVQSWLDPTMTAEQMKQTISNAL